MILREPGGKCQNYGVPGRSTGEFRGRIQLGARSVNNQFQEASPVESENLRIRRKRTGRPRSQAYQGLSVEWLRLSVERQSLSVEGQSLSVEW